MAHECNGEIAHRCDEPVLPAGEQADRVGRNFRPYEPPRSTASPDGAGSRLQRCPRLVAQRGAEPIAQPFGEVAAAEFELRREMRDDFSPEHSGDEQIHLDAEVVVADRLRARRAGPLPS